jgi:hypothetical protein
MNPVMLLVNQNVSCSADSTDRYFEDTTYT